MGVTVRKVLMAVVGLVLAVTPAAALPPVSTTLTPLAVSATTGEKPQSKVWTYAGRWWCVMPNATGTWVWRLDGAAWTNVLQLSASTGVHADVKAVGAVSHVLLFTGASSQLASIEYVPGTQSYQAWTVRPANVGLPLDSSTETATLDVDTQGRMWLASDHAAGAEQIVVYYADAPYASWSGPVTVASGIAADDIGVVTAMPGGQVGVLWSNQNTRLFGFKTHVDGADPAVWSADETPASQSALPAGLGMADDHLNVAVASDGTLYAAVKTSYDLAGYPKMALLVRRPGGTWDDLYEVDQAGTRGIVLLDETAGTLTMLYTSTESAGNILYKETPTSAISMSGPSTVLIPGGLNDVTSTKQNLAGAVVILAGSGSSLSGRLLTSGLLTQLVGWWPFEEGSGSSIVDASGNGNHGNLPSGATWVTGVSGLALNLDGSAQRAIVPDSPTLDITGAITLATWVKPQRMTTQHLIHKGNNGQDGYELSLAGAPTGANGRPFVRFNNLTNGNLYRLNGTQLYPFDGNTWFHLAATYDGATMKLYVNGVLDSSRAAVLTIGANNETLAIGTQSDAQFPLLGPLDDTRVYSRALSDAEIAELAGALPPTTHTITASAGTGGSISPSGAVVVNDGASQAFAIAANAGYHVADVLVDAVSVGAVTSHMFTNVTADHTIAASFAPDAPTGELVGRWRMDEGSGTLVADDSPNGLHGTAIGSPAWVAGVDGPFALSFSINTSQYVQVPDAPALDVTEAITLAAWIRPTQVATASILNKATYNATPSVFGYELNLSSTGVPFVRLFNNTTTAGGGRLNATTSYPTNGTTWMHVAATYDRTTLKIYVNGVLNATLVSTTAIPVNNLPFVIGGPSDGAAARVFPGAIDDARLYNRALTDAEIAALVLANAPPAAPALAGPADQATGVGLAPTLDVVATDADSPQLTVRFYGRAAGAAPAPDFTLIGLPDTQYYTGQLNGGSNAILKSQIDWIVANRTARNIAYVVQLGDCVEHGQNGDLIANNPVEWMRADTAFKRLEDPLATGLADGIPYGICAGNHDQTPIGDADGSTAFYNEYFGIARFTGRSYYGGPHRGSNDNWFDLFSASGQDFISIGLEYDTTPDAAVLAWADSLLSAYPNRRAMVSSHWICNTGNPGTFGAQGQAIYNALRAHSNLFLMLSGHVPGEGRRQDTFNGNTVNTLLSDYQGRTNGGNGWLRILEFSPANNVVRVRTYSPWLDQFEADADSSSQFTLAYTLSGAGPYQLLGTVPNVASGSHATLAWPGLAPGTGYEWYASVSDGASTTTSSPAWSFTTGADATPPEPVADLVATPVTEGHDASGRTRISLGWSGAEPGAVVKVYRKGFGGYPAYDGGAAPAAPASPAAAEAAGWTLTSVDAPGETDQPATRDYWYYVLFLADASGNTSAVSNRTGGTLDYLLGDVSDGSANCAGNNLVNTGDVSLLGNNYGTALSGPGDPLACLDVGPTSDRSVRGLPLADGEIEFEDLVVFALNYTGLGGPGPVAVATAARASDANALMLQVPPPPGVGEFFTVIVRASGRGDIAALALELGYDRSVVEMAGVEGGALLREQGAQALVLTPRPGRVDVALLGRGAGLAGDGELVRVRFRVLAAGAPALALAGVDARDGANRPVALDGAQTPAPRALPVVTGLWRSRPNPFTERVALGFSLAARGPAEVAVYAVDGRCVRTLARGEREPGEYTLAWDGRDERGEPVAAGVYYVRLVTAHGRFTRMVTYLK